MKPEISFREGSFFCSCGGYNPIDFLPIKDGFMIQCYACKKRWKVRFVEEGIPRGNPLSVIINPRSKTIHLVGDILGQTYCGFKIRKGSTAEVMTCDSYVKHRKACQLCLRKGERLLLGILTDRG